MNQTNLQFKTLLLLLVLEGFFEADELPLINEHDLWCVVHSLWQLEAIEQAKLSKPLTIWLKLDSFG
ncbi:alanine racemase, partial [Klebsiella pneumoniae]|uniref:alanine racemase n=1 Tax=Klebsiella pneumoniae TaxID=573 RepID=UPI0027306A37